MRMLGEYDPPHTSAIVFPLGGIGTGSIGLAGNGRLVEFEVANRPAKNTYNGFSFFAVKAEHVGQVTTAKVLQGDLAAPYMGSGDAHYRGFGFGPPRETLAGLPHYRAWRFTGRFPIAEMAFDDQDGQINATLRAFNPFIPLNADDSSLPTALFCYTLTNTSNLPQDVTLIGTLQNPFGGDGVNQVIEDGPLCHLRLRHAKRGEHDPDYGELVLSAPASHTTAQTHWYRGDWFDSLERFVAEWMRPGPFPSREYEGPRSLDSVYDDGDVGMLVQQASLMPGESKAFCFAISWYFPHYVNYWNPGTEGPVHWLNHYATRFSGAMDVSRYSFQNWGRLYAETEEFRDALFSSTVPDAVLDRVSANLSVLKSPTVARLTDGTLYGFEGCHGDAGCCEGSCTHVWNYDQATPFLFPNLARSMREAAFHQGLQSGGRMAVRLLLPLSRTRTESTARAAVDGQMGEVIKVYREWKISGDTEWLRRLWPFVEEALAYAWSPDNADGWDRDGDGVLEGIQHHTLDVEMYGPNAYLTGFYHAALAAAIEMAGALGEDGARYQRLLAQGRAWVDGHLFNGEYFIQQLDLTDRRYPVDPELGEIKYQVGNGCHIDQVIGQWHARVVGLPDIFDPVKVRSALRAVYRYNFRRMRDHVNVHRVLALDDECGVVITTWPHDDAPLVPVPYHAECMTGYEYQVASHMIYEGLVDEGLDVVAALRDRYDGQKRNPWNEIECGSHYARSLASFSVLLALAGFEFDAVQQHLGFRPRLKVRPFSTFWSLGSAWGTFRASVAEARLTVHRGSLSLRSFGYAALGETRSLTVRHHGQEVPAKLEAGRGRAVFGTPVCLGAGETLQISWASGVPSREVAPLPVD